MIKFILTIYLSFFSVYLYASSLKSIQTTCSNFTMIKSSIKANCNAESGAKYISSLRLRGIINYNGILKISSDSRIMSDFHLTCNNVTVDASGQLSASCKNFRNVYTWSAINLNQILRNYNGTLVYPSVEN